MAVLVLSAGETVMAMPVAGVAESTVSESVVGVGVGVGAVALEPQAAMKSAEESGRAARRVRGIRDRSILELILLFAGCRGL